MNSHANKELLTYVEKLEMIALKSMGHELLDAIKREPHAASGRILITVSGGLVD